MLSPLLVTTTGAVTTVTLNRPEKRNALSTALLDALCDALSAADMDPALRVLVLRGSGKMFCAGLDLEEALQPDRAEASAEGVEKALRQLAASRLITIASVQGAAIAGGAGLMSACDFVVATRDCKIGYPEVRRGLVPALIMTFLRRQLHERDARELLLMGKLCTAERAREMGLVNRLASDEAGLETEINAIVSAVLQGAPEAVADTKRLLSAYWPSPLDDDFAKARAVHLAARTSAEAVEGIAAFNEKRAPTWAP